MPRHKKISKNIESVIIDNPKTADKSVEWINVSTAGKEEIEYLSKNYEFNLNHLRASSSKVMAQRPIITHANGYFFLIMHFPVFKDGNIISSEINFFISHGYIITVHNNNIPELKKFFKLVKKDTDTLLSYKFESSAILLYEIIDRLLQYCYTILDQNSIDINNIEDIIFGEKQKQAVSKILELRRNVVNIRKIMQNHKDILKKLMNMESSIVPTEKIRIYYYHLIDYSKNIWAILDNQKEMIDVLNNTNESLLNYHISDIMKTLTIFSVIVFPLTLFAAVFGMNIMGGMPLINNPKGFWIIIALMIIGCFLMLVYFKKKKWL